MATTLQLRLRIPSNLARLRNPTSILRHRRTVLWHLSVRPIALPPQLEAASGSQRRIDPSQGSTFPIFLANLFTHPSLDARRNEIRESVNAAARVEERCRRMSARLTVKRKSYDQQEHRRSPHRRRSPFLSVTFLAEMLCSF